MNKTAKYLIGGAVALLLAGCTVDIQQEEPVVRGLVPIHVTTANPDAALTRAGMEVQESQFQAGEKIHVRFADGTAVDASGTALSNTLFITTDGNGTAEPVSGSPQPYFNPAGSSTTLYAYYPHMVVDENTTVEVGTNESTEFIVDDDQTKDNNYKQSDLMFAKTTALKRGTAVTIPLQFEHRMAKVTIMAMAVDKVKAIKAIRIISGHRGIDIANQETCTLGSTLSVPINKTTPLQVYKNSEGAEVVFCSAVMPPQTIEGNFLEFDAVEETETGTEETTYTYPIRQTVLKSGHSHAMALRIGVASGSDAGAGGSASGSGKSLTVDAITDKTYTGSDIHPALVVRDNNGNTLTEGTHYQLIYSNARYVGRATIIVVGLRYGEPGGPDDYLGCVTTAYFNIVQAEATISFPNPTVEVTWWQEGTYNGNHAVLKRGETVIDNDGTVTYSTDNPSVAAVHPETGKVTLLSPGTATITATVSDSRNHHYATPTASYVLTVLPQTEIILGDDINNWDSGDNNNGTVNF